MSDAAIKELPEGWQLCELGDVMRLKNGYAFKSKDYADSGIPLVRISDIKDGEVVIDKAVHIPDDLANEDFLVEPGDLLIAMSGATTGKTGVYKGVSPVLQNQRVGNFKIIDETAVNKEYRNYYISSLRKDIEKAAYGGAQPNISSKGIESFPFPLAPPEQQKRIVAKIEELFSHIDAGIEALKKAKQLLQQYRQSVLKAFVTGELTKEWREANKDMLEPASQLLERILKERREKWEEQQLEQFKAKGKMPKDDKWKSKYKEPMQVENVAILEGLPSSWERVCLDSLIVDGPQNGLYLPKTKYGSGVPIVRIDDFQDGHVRAYDELQKVSASKSEVETYSLQKGNLIINRVNSPTHLGKCIVVKEGYEPCLFESNMMKAELSSNVSTDYVDYYIQSKYGRSKLIRNAKWAVNQASINQQDVRSTEITLPPFEEQAEITRLVSEKFDGIDRLNNELDIQLSKVVKNKQSILSSAFLGLL